MIIRDNYSEDKITEMVGRIEARGHISTSFTSAAVNKVEQAHRAVADIKEKWSAFKL